jgi:hypothetical protein
VGTGWKVEAYSTKSMPIFRVFCVKSYTYRAVVPCKRHGDIYVAFHVSCTYMTIELFVVLCSLSLT